MQRILPLLQDKVIPWAQNTEPHFVVARPVMKMAAMPLGVTLSQHAVQGKRVLVKNERNLANQRIVLAERLQANLHEMALPKLACVTSGVADYLLGKYCAHCPEGSFILIPPGMPHQCRGPFLSNLRLKDGQCGLLHAYAYSHGIFVWYSRSQDGRHINDMVDNYLCQNMMAVKIFNLLMEVAMEGKDDFEVVCNGLLFSFFSILRRDIKEGHYVQLAPKVIPDTPVSFRKDFAGQIQEYLEANCHKPLNLKDAAAHMYMSTPQFTRRVRRETGTTFVELLTQARIERAKELLCETDWTFTAISGLVSFKSPSYFLSIFRQRTGYTPLEYRRHMAKERR